jgi:uncharacterized protein DUF4350
VSDPSAGARRSFFRPAIALPILAGIAIIAAILTPEATSGRSGDPRLTTYSAEPLGARGFYELASRLGWRVERSTERGMVPVDSASVRAMLAPPQPVTAIEAHQILDQVRRGSALLLVLAGEGPLEDSLPLQLSFSSGTYAPSDTTGCERPSGALALWPDWRVHLFTLKWRKGARVPASPIVFASLDSTTSDSAATPNAAVGFPFGRGRIVVMSDPDFLRNDVLRVCKWGLDVVAIRALEYLRDGSAVPRKRLVIDEYHQGYGAHPGSLTAVGHYLGSTPSGRMLLQVIAAALVLVLAMGVRAVPPRHQERVERRSPLEHVEALAQAYARVGATRTVMSRLLHGIRRRVEPRMRGAAQSDEAVLDAALVRDPRLGDDVAMVRRALAEPLPPNDFERAVDALQHIESSLTAPIA